MASSLAKTLLLEFKVPTKHQNGVLDSFQESAFGKYLLEGLEKMFGTKLEQNYSNTTSKVTSLCFGSGDLLAIFRIYKQTKDYMLVTTTMEYVEDVDGIDDKMESFRADTLKMFNAETPDLAADQDTVIALPSIRRGEPYSSYYTTSDGRLVEFGFTDRLYNVRSPYQHIQIKDSVDYGRILFLDDAVQLAESDSVGYTQAFMNLPQEQYQGKNVLVLGSGDGSLLYELVCLNPGMVTMIDLDEAVLDGCGEHMPKACGEYLKERKGANFEVLVGDAIAYMKSQIDAGKQYDYVFTDLTDMPVSAEGAGQSLWQFLCLVADLAVQLVKPKEGKLMAHCNRKTLPTFISKFEGMLDKLTVPFNPELKPVYTRRDSFVPSFVGTWVFYQVCMK